MPKPLVLYDGVCNFCDAAVLYMIDHDPAARLTFAPLQSGTGQRMIERFGIDTRGPGSVMLIEGNRCYLKSTAALRIARRLRGPSRLLFAFIIVPATVRDVIYDFIARHRYQWFGRRDRCRMPTPQLRRRFVDETDGQTR